MEVERWLYERLSLDGDISGSSSSEMNHHTLWQQMIKISSYAKDKKDSIHLTYYDMFGNYYSQDFLGKTSYDANVKYFAAEPPQLVLRTNRIRYRQ